MKIFELKCKAYLKTNIELKSSFDVLSKYLNYSIYQNEIYKNKDTSIKNYCFGNFYPTESDKIYKKNNVYEFVIRSIDEEFIDELEKAIILNMNNSFLIVLSAVKKEIDQFFIRELYSATPVIVSQKKDDTGRQLYWSLDYNGDMEILQNQLQKNLEKKLKLFYPDDMDVSNNFIPDYAIGKFQSKQTYYKI